MRRGVRWSKKQLRPRVYLALVGVGLAGVFLAAPASLASPSSPPSGVTGMALSGRVELAWQPVGGATAYAVYRGTSQGSITTRVTPTSGVTQTSFADTTAANGTTYYYAVRAADASGESGNSLVVQARPRAASCSTGNYVVQENCRPGDSTWQVTNPGGIEGFATAVSINKGESVDLKVSSGAAFRIEIYRNGYYGGNLARLFSVILGASRDLAARLPRGRDDRHDRLPELVDVGADHHDGVVALRRVPPSPRPERHGRGLAHPSHRSR